MSVAVRVVSSREKEDAPHSQGGGPRFVAVAMGPCHATGDARRIGQAPWMKTPMSLRVLVAVLLVMMSINVMSKPALSFNFTGMWVGTIKYFAMNGTQIDVYSSENQRSLLFVLPPHIPITSADGTQHYPKSDLKVGTLVRVHVNMPYGWGYYGYGATIGAMYVTRIDILNGLAIHKSIQKSLRETLPSPTPGPSPTSPPPVPIIFVSPTPT